MKTESDLLTSFPIVVREKILEWLDKESIANLSFSSKGVVEWMEKIFENKCQKEPYFLHYLSSTYPKCEKERWRVKYVRYKDFEDRWRLRPYKRVPANFETVKELGEGSYSVVFEAREVKHKDFHFAVKQVAKRQVLREKKIAAIQREKEVSCHSSIESTLGVHILCTHQNSRSSLLSLTLTSSNCSGQWSMRKTCTSYSRDASIKTA